MKEAYRKRSVIYFCKEGTQSITILLCILVAVLPPVVMGRVAFVLGLLPYLIPDNLKEGDLSSWVVAVLSRAILCGGSALISLMAIGWGEKEGWLWFKPNDSDWGDKKEENKDKSWTVIGIPVLAVVVILFFEILFSFGAGVATLLYYVP